VQEDDVPARCKERGAVLLAAVEAVRAKFPSVIASVRGAGLMLGVELDSSCVSRSFALRALAREEYLGALASAYLLNVHQVRVLPSLSCPDVLRLEPSAFVEDAAIEKLTRGLAEFCRKVTEGDVAGLVEFLARPEEALAAETMDAAPLPRWSSVIEVPAPGAVRVAFLNHFVWPERELAMTEPSTRRLSMAARRSLFERMSQVLDLKPMLGFARNIFDDKLWFVSITVATDAATLEQRHRMDYRRLETERIQTAVDYAASLGCSAVALGGYTSILTMNGTAILPPPGVKVTSGNTFAVVVQVRRVLDACEASGMRLDDAETRLAVVGATGNIGSKIARILATRFHRMLLVGKRREALEAARTDIIAEHPECEVQVSTEMASVAMCNVITLAVSTTGPLLLPEHITASGKVIVADVSVPSVVSPQLRKLSNVQLVPLSGTVQVPGAADFVVSSHTREGTAFCCAAEAMLLGLDGERTKDLPLIGDVDSRSIRVLEELGERHGLLSRRATGQ